MKSKIFVFTTLILVVFLFVITSCDNFLNAKNKTTININLDLSKILKTSRNETTTSITDYILKVFAYNAATYKPEAEIQNLPLLTQTENKVDINGNVKASLDVEIGLNVIFVAKLYQGKSEKPLYAGKSEVIKIKATDNKVDLVLKRANTDLEIYIEVHQHTFGEYVSNNDATTEADGTKTRECSVCGYEETVVDEGSKIIVPEFVFVKGDTVTGALPAWLDESASDYYKGVFIKDRTVTLSDFYMGKYEVTQKEYASVMAGQKVTVEGVEYELESNPSYCTADSTLYTLFNGDVQEKRPVEGVTWYDSVWYCNALSEKEGLTKAYDIEVTQVKQESGKTGYYIWGAYVTLNKNANGYRLPTEAEWEYAARGGDPTKDDWNYVFSGADTTAGVSYDSEKNADLDSVGWYWYNSINGTTGDTKPSRGEQGFGTHQVGKKAPNRLGLYDMSGNVYEWCYDWYGTITTTTPADGLATSGSVRVHRGGGWSVSAPSASVSYRSYTNPYYRFKYLGFRVVRSATEVIDHTHKFATDWTKDETNHWHAATCEHTTEVSGKAAHSFGNWTTTKEATEEAEGSRERSCTVCGYTATEVIEKLAHTHKFATDWTKDETNHWHAATCEHTTEVSGKAAHSFGNWTTTKEATEEAEGSRERSCTVCGYTATEVIEKLAHTHEFATDWTKDETNHWHIATCEHSTEVSGKAEHSFNWQVNKEASCTEKGEKKGTCTTCGYEKTEITDKAEHSYTDGICVCGLPEGFVLIPAGTFQMGSELGYDDNKPVHQVTITKSFYMGKYEVTQAEYEGYCNYGESSPTSTYGVGNNYPAYYVSWYDAIVYCNKRSISEGLTPCYSISGNTDPEKWGTVPTSTDSKWNAVVCNWNANGYRLPTEAEWEYAARAGDNTVVSYTYSGTSDVNKVGEYAWYENNSNDATHEVGTKLPNAFGLYDMSGNVYEWCWNWKTTSGYDTGEEGGSDPTGTSAGSYRLFRSSCCSDNSVFCAVSFRHNGAPYYRYNYLGFRVVRPATTD